MAGWLAWNLRILSGALIACCAYYGTDYWSNKEKNEIIEKVDFQESKDSDEKEHIELGREDPEILRKYLQQGKVSDNRVIEGLIKNCKENPYLYVNSSTDLINRRYCRLYWNIKESVDILIKTENKQVLLSSESEEWIKKLKEYEEGNKPWGEINKDEEKQVPDKFKELCQTKSKELVYDVNVNEYSNVVKFCTRRKNVKDVLGEKGFRLLGKEGNDENIWKEKFSEYLSTDRGERFKTKPNSMDNFKKECEEVIKSETMISGYKNSLSVAERYCSTKENK